MAGYRSHITHNDFHENYYYAMTIMKLSLIRLSSHSSSVLASFFSFHCQFHFCSMVAVFHQFLHCLYVKCKLISDLIFSFYQKSDIFLYFQANKRTNLSVLVTPQNIKFIRKAFSISSSTYAYTLHYIIIVHVSFTFIFHMPMLISLRHKPFKRFFPRLFIMFQNQK